MAGDLNDCSYINALVSSIYDAAADSARWPEFINEFGSSLSAGVGMLWIHDFRDGSADFSKGGGSISAFTGLDAQARNRYTDYYVGRNVWLPNASRLPEGSTVVSSALYPDSSLQRTEFYNDWLRDADLFYGVGCSIVKQDTRDVKMSFARSKRAGPYADAELRVMRLLMPHLRNAVVLHRELYRLNTLSASAMASLELVPLGVILLTSSGLLMHANQLAHDLVARTGVLRFGAGGTIHAASVSATASLRKLIQAAAKPGKRMEHGGALRLFHSDGRELQVLVTPLPLESSRFGAEAAAAIFCSDPQDAARELSPTLQAIYRMTPAEAQLTEAVVNGRSLKEYAQARSVSINTVRTQLQAAAEKAGAKRQADLVRIILRGPAVLCPSAASSARRRDR